jgi:hypothetical protein
MTSAPYEDRDTGRGADPGFGEPAQDTGDGVDAAPSQPDGYPEEVDPAQGPVTGRAGASTGDLEDPGAR